MTETPKKKRRTDEERLAELQAKVDRKQVRTTVVSALEAALSFARLEDYRAARDHVNAAINVITVIVNEERS